MLIEALAGHLKSWQTGVNFAYLNFKDHPRGCEMFVQLVASGHIPSIVIEELSELGALGTQEQNELLLQLSSYVPCESVENVCKRDNIPYFLVRNINDNDCLEHIQRNGTALILLGDSRIIRPHLIHALKIGIINVHPGLLPEERGNNPYVWAVLEGIQQGVTVHFIDEGIDTGPVLSREILVDTPKDYPSLVKSLNTLCGQALVSVLDDLKSGALSLTLQTNTDSITKKKASAEDKNKANEILINCWGKTSSQYKLLKFFERNESNVRTYCRNHPAIFQTAQNSLILDIHGKHYIDFLSGAGSLNYGHNDPDIIKSIIDYLSEGGIVQSLDLHTEAKQKFIATFITYILKPRNMHYKFLFPGPTGTNAVEAAFKLARKHTKRRNIISFSGAFHGMSLGALAATANKEKRAAAGTGLIDTTILPYENAFGKDIDSASIIEKMVLDPTFGIDPPAAIILEVIQGEGGLSTASGSWLRRIQALCRNIGALLIIDDIQCGCGRSGSFFSFEEAGIEPDIILLSKALSGFGTPLSLVLVKEEYDVLDPGEHNGTFRGNNLGFIGATAAIEKFWKTEELQTSVRTKAQYIHEKIGKLTLMYGENNMHYVGRGLISGIRFTNPAIPTALSHWLFKKGFIIETCGALNEVLKIIPSLIIDTKLIDRLFSAIEEYLRNLSKEPTKSPPQEEPCHHEQQKPNSQQ
ncbi:diaminobutyrate--2-oxoglutarate transaminase [Pseudomonas cyclaminis]|uniref:diaminobutyrate--2-oxoglutarate transaminase n=1 Tax=Pseudomonas cyclaminis TaxID=2781239 RepID=UPI0037F42D03